MSVEIRRTEPHEWRAAAECFRAALISAPQGDSVWAEPHMPASWADSLTFSAWDGARCVGHVAGFRFRMLVPGGAVVPMSGVTRVGVLPTHTRRGILTGLMRELLLGARDEGAVCATLRASEAVIYGRFGFAVAGDFSEVEINRHRGARVVAPTAPGTIRLVPRDEILATVTAVHARVGLDRPGAIERPQWMHERLLLEPMGTEKAAFVIVHSDPDGVDDGWAQYSTEWPEDDFGLPHADCVCNVADVWGATPQVELALWKFILELDLIDIIRAGERPIDDAVRFALDNPRAHHAKVSTDEQWLRLLDVDAALTARTYRPAAGSVTIGITDPLIPENTGSWRVSAAGAERVAGDVPVDLTTTIQGISAAYLGGTAWHDLWVGGKVSVHTPGALALADQLFASKPLPRCGTFF